MCVELHILMDTALSFCFELQRPRRRIFILRRGLSPYTALSPIGSHCVPMGLNLWGGPSFLCLGAAVLGEGRAEGGHIGGQESYLF